MKLNVNNKHPATSKSLQVTNCLFASGYSCLSEYYLAFVWCQEKGTACPYEPFPVSALSPAEGGKAVDNCIKHIALFTSPFVLTGDMMTDLLGMI